MSTLTESADFLRRQEAENHCSTCDNGTYPTQVYLASKTEYRCPVCRRDVTQPLLILDDVGVHVQAVANPEPV